MKRYVLFALGLMVAFAAAAETPLRAGGGFLNETRYVADRKVCEFRREQLPTVLVPRPPVPDLVTCSPVNVGLPLVGHLKPRAKPDPKDDQWMIGCEVLDRDFAKFSAYKDYLPLLGIPVYDSPCLLTERGAVELRLK